MIFLDRCYCTFNRLQYSVNKNLHALGNQKICLNHFIVKVTLLLWSGTKPAMSPSQGMPVQYIITEHKQKNLVFFNASFMVVRGNGIGSMEKFDTVVWKKKIYIYLTYIYIYL